MKEKRLAARAAKQAKKVIVLRFLELDRFSIPPISFSYKSFRRSFPSLNLLFLEGCRSRVKEKKLGDSTFCQRISVISRKYSKGGLRSRKS